MSGEARFLHRRVMNMVAKGVIESTNDIAGIQRQDLSLLDEEAKTGVERFQDYGFSSHPLRGSEATTVFFGGGRDHGMIVKCDDRLFRIRGLGEGEVSIYSDEGDTIILKRGNVMEVTTKTLVIKAATSASIQAPVINLSGLDGAATVVNVTGVINASGEGGGATNVAVTGNLTASQTITADTVNAPHGNVGGSRGQDSGSRSGDAEPDR